MIESLKLSDIHQLYATADFEPRGDADFLYLHFSPEHPGPVVAQDLVRFDGLMFFFLTAGRMTMSVNVQRSTLRANQLTMVAPNAVLSTRFDADADADVHVLLVSTQMLHELHFDIAALSSLPVSPRHRSPLMELSAKDIELLREYLALLEHSTRLNAESNAEQLSRGIARNLLVALFYQLMLLSSNGVEAPAPDKEAALHERPRSRRTVYTQDFIRLVRRHFRQEHSVAFYAGKLCISPKYLSLVIKEATGRSAAEIIDEFVILEAKNLLRFSGKNIQQVAYELNFNNQSSFGKYFKHLTGMSPSEFQNS